MSTDVAVIIVNYGTAEMAVAAADSVLDSDQAGLEIEVHLVDNASPDPNERVILESAARRWGGRATIYFEATNHGFGRGNNLVLRELQSRASPPDKVYLLNPDAKLVTSAVAQLSDFLDAHPRAAVVGSGIIHEGSGAPAASAFRFPGVISEFTGAVHLGILSRLFSRWEVPYPADLPSREVDWVSGASMMARLKALAEVDFFDPDYFLYYEEVDLMHRLKRKGWQIWHLPTAKVEHAAGASTGVKSDNPERPPLPEYWYDSWRLYYEKLHGRGGAKLAAAARLFGNELGNALCRMRGIPARNPRNFAEDFRRYVMGPLNRPALPRN